MVNPNSLAYSFGTTSLSPVTIELPGLSYRHSPDPLNAHGIHTYIAVVRLDAIPNVFGQWIEVNPREATERGSVPAAIRETLMEDPLFFGLYNRGLSILADEVSWDNHTDTLTVSFKDPRHHGLCDGNHSLFNAMLVAQDLIAQGQPVDAFFRIEFITGLTDPDRVSAFSAARNTSNQVHLESLADQAQEYSDLKEALVNEGINVDQIRWHENDSGDLDVRELIAYLSMLNTSRWNDLDHPIQSYYGKAVTLKYFLANKDEFKPIYPLAADLIKLPEHIRHHVPTQQLANGSSFGGITGIRSLAPNTHYQPFTGLSTGHIMPDAYIYPLLAAFRAMVDDSGTEWKWAAGVDPFQFVADGLASDMFRNGIFPTISALKNAMAVGKSPSIWGHCYTMAELAYYRAARGATP